MKQNKKQQKNIDVVGAFGAHPPPSPPLADRSFQISTYKLDFREVATRYTHDTQKNSQIWDSKKKYVKKN